MAIKRLAAPKKLVKRRPDILLQWCKIRVHAGIAGKAIPCPGSPRGQSGLNCDCTCHTDARMSDMYVRRVREEFLLRIAKEGRTALLDDEQMIELKRLGWTPPRKLKKKLVKK